MPKHSTYKQWRRQAVKTGRQAIAGHYEARQVSGHSVYAICK